MDQQQIMIFAILGGTMVLFLWGRWRHDIVALLALMATVLTGLVDGQVAFTGFAEPAVITVACVLVLSRGLQRSGAVEALARRVIPAGGGLIVSLTAICVLAAAMSAFMNNVGALALLMPVAIRVADRNGVPAGQLLMPLSFATILGGMVTLIGTPPNLIVSTFRDDAGLAPYKMFDFAWVGLPVALAGVALMVLFGWRLVPRRSGGADQDFQTGAYFTELRVEDGSRLIDATLAEAEEELSEAGAQIVGLVRNGVQLTAPRGSRKLIQGDILIAEAEFEALPDLISRLGLKLEQDTSAVPRAAEEEPAAQDTVTIDAAAATAAGPMPRAADAEVMARLAARQGAATPAPPAAEAPADDGADANANAKAEGDDAGDRRREPTDYLLREYVVPQDSQVLGRSPLSMSLRTRYSINLLAVSRSGARATTRLRNMSLRSGDLVLLQGTAETLSEFAQQMGLIPLAGRALDLPGQRDAMLAGGIMIGAIALAGLGILPTAIAFTLGVLAVVMTRIVPLREMYDAIDWSVIVLLAALFPVAAAMEQTGAAALLAEWIVGTVAQGNVLVSLALVLIVTMTLSDIMNNAATAAVMCPIAVNVAGSLGVGADGFLMAVAIGASCAFLTPIGHQNNTLILGPGGFRFGDYWRLGIIMEIIVVAVSLPLLMIFWM